MKRTFATYEHTTIGWPKVILRWSTEDGDTKTGQAYVVVDGVITCDWEWYNTYPMPFIQFECERFDTWVRGRYADRTDLQG